MPAAPSSEDLYVPQSAMIIVAHPDDIEYVCAGTLALWARAGARLSYVLCTSGEAGIEDPGISRDQAMAIREAEQRRAAEIVGAKEVIFLGEPDGLLEPTLALRRKLVREIRRFRPEVVICGDPTVIWLGPTLINHADHRAAAYAALDATWPAAGQPGLFRELEQEGLRAHRPRRLYITGWIQPGADLRVDVTATLEVKAEALRAHASQVEGDPLPFLQQWAAANAASTSWKYAETFRVVQFMSDEDWERTRGVRG
jgi:LmbE family N-acetylglucosaminyl deacetylase